MRSILIIFPLVFATLLSCSSKPEPIVYGSDACYFCKMGIVDKTHASQAVSSKGKQFKYDSVECMVNDIQNNHNTDMDVILVADYLNAGEMIPAESAFYIISPEIPSPMGANLSAVKSKAQAEKLQQEFSGDIFSWQELLNRNKTDNHSHQGHY